MIEDHIERVEAAVQTVVTGLEVGFFQRPVVEERVQTAGGRQGGDRRVFAGREVAGGERREIWPLAPELDIDAHLHLTADSDEGQIAGVRHIEAQRVPVQLWIEVGLAEGRNAELDLARGDAEAAGEDPP